MSLGDSIAMSARLRLSLLSVCALTLGACLPPLPLEDEGSSASNDDANADASADADAGSGVTGEDEGETGLPPVPMVSSGDFLIDAHEVRVGDYIEFYKDIDNYPELPAECEWKTSHEPGNWLDRLPPEGDLEKPVAHVDWCDAWAYCEWSGKHMCGLVGGEAAALNEAANLVTNEWFRACTGDGKTFAYPYSETYDPAACNGDDYGLGKVIPVATLSSCEGGYPGLFDMSGNVWEWTNACATEVAVDPEVQLCRRRGGSSQSSESSLACTGSSTRERNERTSTIGIRCCQIDEGSAESGESESESESESGESESESTESGESDTESTDTEDSESSSDSDESDSTG